MKGKQKMRLLKQTGIKACLNFSSFYFVVVVDTLAFNVPLILCHGTKNGGKIMEWN